MQISTAPSSENFQFESSGCYPATAIENAFLLCIHADNFSDGHKNIPSVTVHSAEIADDLLVNETWVSARVDEEMQVVNIADGAFDNNQVAPR
jgi:hypothetical protein